jgi:DNA-binding transcriptional LysR family regulator
MPRGSLTDVTILMTIADQLSFRAAASRLGVTASALSHSKPDLRQLLHLGGSARHTREFTPNYR